MTRDEDLRKAESEAVSSNIRVLETLYTIVISLALTQATYRLVEIFSSGNGVVQSAGPIILYISFLVTVVPFYQGMSRFLYETHVVRPLKKPDATVSPLLLDIYAFIFLSALFFVLGRQLEAPLTFFFVWSALLIIDIIWAILVWGIQKSRRPKWAFNNMAWLAAAWVYLLVVVDTPGQMFPDAYYIYGFVLFEVGRTITDYYLNWTFYFPRPYKGQPELTSKITYLAGPYSNDAPENPAEDASPERRRARFQAITEVAKALVEEGEVVYSPLTMTHPIDVRMSHDPGSDYWVKFDESFMQHCNIIKILMLPGWNQSSGVKREIDFFAKKGIEPIFLEPSDCGIKEANEQFASAFKASEQ